ncbi:MAG TPA: PAS domain-containing protein [Candidatus Acidoferrales bacterium]|jgi:PAS domain S-box-containing protein|nr:PAS domain-containing protein [Candidatus Acidoferrales bacterium]
MKASKPANETQRLETLRQYDVLDTPPEQAFDDLTLLASRICQTPIAMVSLVDDNRQWFKSKTGIDATETARDIAFSAHTILRPGEVMEVQDACADERFAGNPLVTTDPHIRFYAGAPLVANNGQPLGALCVMDRTPHALKPEQLAALQALSRLAVAQLEQRRQARELTAEILKRNRAEELQRHHYEQLSASKAEADRLVALGEKSRRALLSVLEDEKLSGQNLRTSEERFRQLAENINEVFWITDPAKHQMLYISPAYEKIWGRSCKSLYQNPQTWLDAIHPHDRDRIMQAAESKQTEGTYDEVYRVIRPDKSERWVHDRAFPIRNEAGEVYRVVGTAEDITERRKLEEQLRHAQKMEAIGQLAGGVAHDFNNILAVIRMQSDLMRFDDDLSGEQKESVDEITAAAERATNLTRQLLLFSRHEKMQPHDLDLGESISDLAKMLRRILGEDIQMHFKFAAQPLHIHADPGMIDQVVMNLTINSRDAMPNGGNLFIETTTVELDELAAQQSPRARPGSFVCLSVTDTGCGIPAEIIPRIFEPFFTTKGVGKGTGLGLATVFGIVANHRGWVDVYSEVHRGTTFRVFFPRLTGAAARPKHAPVTLQSAVRGDETILLVEDDNALRLAFKRALSQLGYHVIEAGNGATALDLWNQHRSRINLLLTDLVMPGGMNGKEFAEKLLAEAPKLKVIYMSGYSPDITLSDLHLGQGIHFLAKPFDTIALAKTIRAALETTGKQPEPANQK